MTNLRWIDRDPPDALLERVAIALEERNHIEKAKLAEMRAARLEQELAHVDGRNRSWVQEHTWYAYIAAHDKADDLTAEVLGEVGE